MTIAEIRELLVLAKEFNLYSIRVGGFSADFRDPSTTTQAPVADDFGRLPLTGDLTPSEDELLYYSSGYSPETSTEPKE